MSRIARIVLEGVPYHITQRGYGRQQIFFDERDYVLYLDLLRNYAASAGLQLWAYCLMPNHVHAVALPERPRSMANAMGRTNADYARHFNLARRSCGHVWQSRFFSCPLDPAHLWRAMAYVERNPVRAGIVEVAGQYRWSTAPVHLGMRNADDLAMKTWRMEYTPDRWNEVLRSSTDEEAFGQRLQEAARRGRPLGPVGFVEELERKTGRSLRPVASGRPRKKRGDYGSGQLGLPAGV
jgi:putative transposase